MLELQLCELYHCLPSQLDGEDWNRIQDHLAVHNARAEYDQEHPNKPGRKIPKTF
jgi:hypothetical protein